MDLTGHTLLGKYEIEGLIGQGGMGAVWRARHSMTGRKLAIKVLDESYVGNRQVAARFGREARAASLIQHPGIVEVLDLDNTDAGIPFMVMEFLEGETLARRIERRGRLDQAELLRLGGMLLEALDAAHSHGVIHRDLKPENIYVVPAGRRGEIVKILDFGISHLSTPQEHKLTMTGSVLGTPHYMSPEQAMGETQLDHRADLYATGVVLYECVVGDVPYDAPNYNKLLRRILDESPASPRERGAEISPEVERVILWAMEKQRDLRIPSARELRDWLIRAAEGESPPYTPRHSVIDVELDLGEPEGAPLRRPAGSLPTPPPAALSSPTAWRSSDRPPSLPPPPDQPPTGVEDEISDQWQISPTLAQMSKAPSSSPPPSGSVEIDMGLPLSPRSSLDLELDEGALRASNPTPRPAAAASAAVGTASSSGQYRVLSRSSAGAVESPNPSSSGTRPAATASSAGTISVPPTAGLRSVPPRLSELSTPAPAYDDDEPPAWRRYAMYGLILVGAIAAIVVALRIAFDRPDTVGDATGTSLPVTDPITDPSPHPNNPGDAQWVSIRIVGLPPGARMRLDELPASSPLRVRRGGQHVLVISAPGYEDRRMELETDRDRIVHARMVPAVGTVRGE
ncbi:MAG: serine/threonine-protein kinase [Sandaracinaceae bacterium]